MRTGARLAALAFACALGACSGGDAPGGDGGPTPDGGAANDLAGASTDLAGPPDLAPPPSYGLVMLMSNNAPAQSFVASNVSAFFDTVTSSTSSCVTTTMGVCLAFQCTGPSTSTRVHHSAGALHVAGGAFPVALTPAADSSYTARMSTSALWSGGEQLTITGAGAEVPAFTASVTAPAAPRISAPLAGGATTPTIVRAQDLGVTWSGGTVGTVDFSVNDSGGKTTINCHFPVAAGAGTVPAALLQLLPAGAGSSGAQIRSSSDTAVTGWIVQVWAYSLALLPDGKVYGGSVTIQ